MSEVHGDTQSTVTLILHGLDFAEPGGNPETLVNAGIGCSLRRTLARGLLQHEFHDILELHYIRLCDPVVRHNCTSRGLLQGRSTHFGQEKTWLTATTKTAFTTTSPARACASARLTDCRIWVRSSSSCVTRSCWRSTCRKSWWKRFAKRAGLHPAEAARVSVNISGS